MVLHSWGIFKLGIIGSHAHAAHRLASLLQTYVDPPIHAQLTNIVATLNRIAVPS